jgi:TolB-like protein
MIRAIFTPILAVVAVAGMAAAQVTPSISVGAPLSSGNSTGHVVLVLPISPPAAGNNPGISQSIQQDLVADLTTLTSARVIAPVEARPATNEQAALDAGRQNNADFVVWGQSQISGSQMRVTGQLLRVSDGHPLAGLKATAPTNDLFPLEDSLAAQVAKALPAPIGLVTPPPQTQPAEQGGYVSEPQPLPTTAAPPNDSGNPYYSYTETIPQSYYTYNTYYYPTYWSPYWGYGYWGYPYYWGGIGIGIYGGGWWPYHHGWYGHGWYGGHYYGHPYAYGFRGGYGGYRGGFSGGFHGGGGFHSGGFAGHGGGGGHR